MALQYHDLVLIGIVASVTAGALVGALTSVSSLVAIVSACALAGLIGHAIFVGPVEGIDDLSKEVERVGPVELSD